MGATKLMTAAGGGITLDAASTASDKTITLPAVDDTMLTRTTNVNSGTAVASTSGTSIDFTGIPSWVKRITILIKGMSSNGTSLWIVRLGTSGGFVTTGYLSTSMAYGAGSGGSTGTITSGFSLTPAISSSSNFHGIMTIANISNNSWVSSFSGAYTDAPYAGCGGGSIDLGGTLDRVRITTVNGTDTFDAGSINILYE